MPGGPTAVVLKELQTLFRIGTAGGLTDGQLLERFLSQRDDAGEAAFRALVERHAPMVLRICRDVLADWHEAEDASQATFIVLACKAGSIRKRDSIASWLFGVACRVAAHAKAKSARRRRHEQRNAEQAAASIVNRDPRVDWLELYEEVERLPEHWRAPLVLCDVKGHSQPEAAAQLGCPLRTLQNRLARGRERLRMRLIHRDLSTSVAVWERSVDPDRASVPLPPAWLETTVRAALTTVNHTTATGAISASVAALTEGMLRMMLRTTLISVAGVVLSVGILGMGMGLLVYRTAAAPPPYSRPAGAASPALPTDDPPREEQERVAEIIVRAGELAHLAEGDGLDGIVAIDPRTGKWRPILKGLSSGPGPVSPDGRYIVYSSLGVDQDDDQAGIWVYDMKGETPLRRIFERRGEAFWTNNGQQIVIGTPVGQKWDKFETWRVNADGTGRAKLPVPGTDLVLDCSRDGAWLATRTVNGEPAPSGPAHPGSSRRDRGTLPDRRIGERRPVLHLSDLPGRPERCLRGDQDRERPSSVQTVRRGHRGQAPA